MGTFSQRIALGPVAGQRFKEVEAVVDTGATYTWVPRPLLEELGIVPEEEFAFVLADRREVVYPIAQVKIRLDGRERISVCVFGDEETDALLGSYTLEGFGLAVDTVNKRLVRVRGYLLGGKKRQ